MSIGKNIAKYRKARGLTQEELGVKLGVTNQAVSKWESEVSMPDVMLLPEIAITLGITLEDIYGIAKVSAKISVSADDFPSFCHKKLIELFYDNAKVHFLHKELGGFRLGCVSNTQGAIVISEDFSFIDCNYKATKSEDILRPVTNDYTLMYLTDQNFRKVFYYQYKVAFEKSKAINTEFTFDEIMRNCNLTESETSAALQLLQNAHINVSYIDRETKTKKFVFLISNALYAHAIYKLVELLSEDSCFEIVRDTSMISDYVFKN